MNMWLWLISLATLMVLALLLWPALRRRWVTGPIMVQMQRAMPPLSRTEQEALESGSVWWERELFSGKPDWEKLIALPADTLTREEHAFLDGPVERLCASLDNWRIQKDTNDLPDHIWAMLKREGFFGMIIPPAYGGLGFSARAHSAVVSKIASRSVTAAVTVMVPNSLGPAELLMRYGSDAQRQHYLPRLARGDEIPCFALTSPRAGSDAGAIPDSGVVCRERFKGQQLLGVRLNWDKRYITLAPVATLLGLAFKLYDPDHLLSDEQERGITLALIPTHLPGISIGTRHDPLGVPFLNGPTRGHDVFIPMDYLIGGEQGIGQGWRMLMACLAEGRGISLPALSVGAAKLATRSSSAYARVRSQFGLSIGRFEGVQEALGRMGLNTYRMEAARAMTVSALDQGERPAVAAGIVKYHLTEGMRQSVNDAMDLWGGGAICRGPHNMMAQAYQAVPIGITVEGANILTRTMMIFGQGAIRAHPYLLKEIECLNSDRPRDARIARFDALLIAHIGHTLRNGLRAFSYGLLGSHGAHVPQGVNPAELKGYRQLSHWSAAFAFMADLALARLGGSLKRKESLSALLGDALSHLYLASAVLNHFRDCEYPEHDRPLMEAAFADSMQQVRRALMGVVSNFPDRLVAMVMRLAVFPTGMRQQSLAQHHLHRVAELLQRSGPARDHLTEGIYLGGTDGSDPMAELEKAFVAVQRTEKLERRFNRWVKKQRHQPQLCKGLHIAEGYLRRALEEEIVTELEAKQLRDTIDRRMQVVRVDEFPAVCWLGKEVAA
uniref:Acyl-coenzyme A dehydrogenase n=1 Tax=Magnetococcus massalia (strain MO-1) TaxID=451514 RepID=A0A1S7LDB2_MAGMO|nr:Acyl-coenzyme A dehydrogenase [Candidatus Magnetococcus massalia]